MDPMRSLAATIRDARKSVKLSESMMARLAGIDRDELVRFEKGGDDPPAAVLERYARMFGLSIRSFVLGGARQAPLGVLFRSMFEGYRPSVGQLASTGAHLVLGEMLRCARDMADLRERMGERREPSPIDAFAPVPVEPGSRTPHGAQELARRVREQLHLGGEPIASVLDLVQAKLGIDVLWVTPDELDRDIDAASALAPGPVIVRALAAGRIDPAEARDHLRLSPCDELPPHEGLDEAARAPLWSGEDRARRYAERYLQGLQAMEPLYTGRVSREPGGGFRVEVVAGHGRGPFRPVGHLRMTEGLEVVWADADEREALFARLVLGMWLIVDVYSGFLTMHAERLPGSPASRHGPLMRRSPADLAHREDLGQRWPHPRHAIVLVEEVTGGFRYLDPWFPKKGQPFFVGRAAFAEMWTGRVVIPGHRR
jgi:transcriptional regulator with XRE-family HTH domain